MCYRTICAEGAEQFGGNRHPEITMHTPPLVDYVACLNKGDWPGVGELMLASAEKLALTGAQFLICPDNTIHQALPHVETASPLPWLHIAEVVAEAAQARGFQRLALTGTRWLVECDLYPDKLSARGIAVTRPAADERAEIDRIIMDELVRGRFTSQAIAYFQQVIDRLKTEGCDAVLLGCTEIPLIIDDGNSPLPTLDSTRLLARAALRKAANI